MRHRRKGRKLGVRSDHRKQVLRNLAAGLILGEQITTTEGKGKEVKRFVEHLMSLAVRLPHSPQNPEEKNTRLTGIRRIFAELPHKQACIRLLERAKEFSGRETGFLHLYRLLPRKGDSAPRVLLKWVESEKAG
ncbi:MAG: bL17 family ribosomal protein [bacterium]